MLRNKGGARGEFHEGTPGASVRTGVALGSSPPPDQQLALIGPTISLQSSVDSVLISVTTDMSLRKGQ